MSSKEQDVANYWDVKPPFKADESAPEGSLEWYRSISRHRFEQVAPHRHKHVKFDEYAGKDLVEIGIGAGTDFVEFVRNGARATGLDITDKAVGLARDRLHVEGLEAEVKKYDGRTLPLPDNSQDVVFSWGVIHHSPNWEHLFSEVHRVLRPGGKFLSMLYHRFSILYYYSILYLSVRDGSYEKYPRGELLGRFSEFREGCPFTLAYTESEIRDILWYFEPVDVAIEYPVYDERDARKIWPKGPIDFEPTGISDIDMFLRKFNAAAERGENLDQFGWHLVINAYKPT